MSITRFTLLIVAGAATLAALPALGDDLPKRKSGLWEIKTASAAAGDEARLVQMCVDQKADDPTGQAAARAKQMCSKNEMQRSADRLTIDSVCKFGASTAITRSVITGNFDAAYHVESASTYDPPLDGMKETKATIDAHWLGPCKADQKPGDMMLSNGVKINLNDTLKRK